MRVSIWLYILEQMGVTCCLLLSIGLAAHLRLSALRLLLVSLVCAISSALAATATLAVRLGTLLFAATLSPLAAYPGLPPSLRLRVMGTAWLLSLTASGLLRLFAPLPLPSALIVAAACALLRLIPIAASKSAELPRLATVDVRCGPHHIALTALIDSGNLLRDTLTGLPVVVISRRAAERLGRCPPEGTLLPGMRLMPIRTAAGRGLMPLFRPDTVCLNLAGAWQRADCLIGVSPDGHEGFQALVPASLACGEPSTTSITSEVSP